MYMGCFQSELQCHETHHLCVCPICFCVNLVGCYGNDDCLACEKKGRGGRLLFLAAAAAVTTSVWVVYLCYFSFIEARFVSFLIEKFRVKKEEISEGEGSLRGM